MRTKIVIFALSTTAIAAARRRRPVPAVVKADPLPPTPERSRLLLLVEDGSDLVLADQDARDEHVLAVLDAHLLRAG